MSTQVQREPVPYPLTLLYDASCPVCRQEIEALIARDAAGRLRAVDASAPDYDAGRHGVARDDAMRIMHAVAADGRVLRGTAVFRAAYGAVGLGWVWQPTGWPLLEPLFSRAYLAFARNRNRVPPVFARALLGLASWLAPRAGASACADGVCATRPEARP